MELTFLGAVRQVTGSCFVLKAAGLKMMVDCGLFQERCCLARNWDLTDITANEIDYLLLTHAHLDHSGRIPRLVSQGYRNPIIATEATADLTKIVLEDAARLQTEDTEFKKERHKREGRTGPHPVVPLYTEEDVEMVLPLIQRKPYGTPVHLSDKVTIQFHDAGHILGSSILDISVWTGEKPQRILFSGDLGQWDRPLVRDPSIFEQADYIVLESTYGDRDHEVTGDVKDQLAQVINDTVERGGNIVIPTFAIERAQELMYHLSELVREDRIPHLMVFLDSPMAVNVTRVFEKHLDLLDKDTAAKYRQGEPPFEFPGLKLVRHAGESKAVNRIKGSCIIMAGSGMCTGGRIKHHLSKNIIRPESTILFVGYQSRETLGRQILDGEPEVRIHGQMHPVRARIAQIHGLSAHADRTALLRWLSYFKTPPKCLYMVHGEEEAALAFADQVRKQTGWNVAVPAYKETWDLGRCSRIS